MRSNPRSSAAVVVVALALVPVAAFGQPLAGDYTVGGNAPAFARPQLAADALLARGVSGPVRFLIRPGVYLEAGGAASALALDAPVPGASAVNTVTFEADPAFGENPANVVIAMNLAAPSADGVARVSADHVTFRRLTFADRDSGQAGAPFLLRFVASPANPTLEGLAVEHCRFVGNPTRTHAGGLGTDYGLHGVDDDVRGLRVAGCTFTRLLRALHVGADDASDVSGVITVEDVEVTLGFDGATGSGNPLGDAIFIGAQEAYVRRTTVDYLNGSGYHGILVRLLRTGAVERCVVRHGGPPHPSAETAFVGIRVDQYFFQSSDSALIVNNMVHALNARTRTGLVVTATGSRIAHNSIALADAPTGATALHVDAPGCTVLDNILVVEALLPQHTAFLQGPAAIGTLASNHNVLYAGAAGRIVRRPSGEEYTAMSAYQAATGLDAASAQKRPEFVHFHFDLHLTDCAAQDPDLAGVPVAGVAEDADGQVRDPARPLRGADEVLRPRAFFTPAFRVGLPGTPFAVAAGTFDDPLAPGLAVTDYDGEQVHLFRSLPSSRSFAPAGSLGVPFEPYAARFFDLDDDGHLDLLVAGEAAAVIVFWGDGAGGFPDSTHVPTLGRVRSIEPEPHRRHLDVQTVFLTEDNGFVPTASWIGALLHLGNRVVCHDVLRDGSHADTLFATATDLIVEELGGDDGYDLAAIALGGGPSGELVTATELHAAFLAFAPCPYGYISGHAMQPAPIASYVGHSASLASGDFDRDGDRDLITTGFSDDTIVRLVNGGGLAFTPELMEVNDAVAVVSLDYDDDGDLDVATVNHALEDDGVTLFLNDGRGAFTRVFNCFAGYGHGTPFAVAAADFDLDGLPDLAIGTSFDSLHVLYNAVATFTAVDPAPPRAGPAFALGPCAPQPVRTSARIGYALPAAAHVRLTVHDLSGRRVATLVDGWREAGSHEAAFERGPLASGVYFYRLESGGRAGAGKLLLVR